MAVLGARTPASHFATGTTVGWEKFPVARAWADFRKAAELGGDADSGFETAFANLAHTVVRDRAPALLKYEVGFQLVEKAEDGTKVLGVFAFKVGKSLLYVPVFFLNGKLKGHELLWLKNQDLFVPLKEPWVNYLTGRDPALIGRPIPKSISQRLQAAPQMPDFSGRFKAAAAKLGGPAWLADFWPCLAKMAFAPLGPTPDVLAAAAAIGPKAAGYFHWLEDHFPAVGATLKEAWGDGYLTGLDARVAPSVFKRAAVTATDDNYPNPFKTQTGTGRPPLDEGQRPQVILREDQLSKLSPDGHEAEEMFRTGRVVRDKRKSTAVSVAYRADTSGQLFNPPESGLYDVLVKPDGFKRMLVLLHPRGDRGPCPGVLLVDPDKPTRSALVDPRLVWARGGVPPAEFKKWFDGLDGATSLPGSNADSWKNPEVVVLGPDGQATCPMRVRDDCGEDGYEVNFRDYVDYQFRYVGGSPLKVDFQDSGRSDKPVRRVRLGFRGTKLRVVGDELVVPAGFKKLTVRAGGDDDGDEPLNPGNLVDLKTWLVGSLRPLELSTAGADGQPVAVNGKTIDKYAAFKHLVEDWGLAAAAADQVLAEAAARPRHKHAYLVRLAAGFAKTADPYLTDRGPYSPAWPDVVPNQSPTGLLGRNMPHDPSFEAQVPVPDMMPGPQAREDYARDLRPDDQTDVLGTLQEAASTGQREVIDTTAFAGMLKAVGDDSVVDRYLPDLTKGMDRLGRIRFQLLWHREKLEERYGRQDLPALDDSVVNAFEAVGDVLLTLRRKNPEDTDPLGIDVDLDDAAQS